jgi:hypothetical protein
VIESSGTRLVSTIAILSVLLFACREATAQELEPGAYQNAPVGMNVLFAGYGFSQGNILFDAALPIEGADAVVHGIFVGYLRTLNLAGRSAKLDAQLPVSRAHFEGIVAGEHRTRSPNGLGDPRVRLREPAELAGPSISLASHDTVKARSSARACRCRFRSGNTIVTGQSTSVRIGGGSGPR